MYALSPKITSGSKESPILIDGVDLVDRDIIYPVTTVENLKVIYTFGTDYGEVTINGTCLLGSAAVAGGGGSFSSVKAYFETNRISRTRRPIKVSLPGTRAYNVYLRDFGVGMPDPQFNIQPFSFRGLLAAQQ